MVCRTCGSELNQGEKFCRYCGTAVNAGQQPNFAPTYSVNNQTYQQPQAPKKGPKYAAQPPKAPKGKLPKKGLLIGGIAAAVAVVILVGVLLLSSNPSAKVASAFSASVREFNSVYELFGLQHAAQTLKSESSSQDLDVQLEAILADSDAAFLVGAGVRVQLDADLDKHHIGMQAVPYFGSADLANVMLTLEEDMIYFALPQLLSDTYGLSTLTVMEDLERMGADVGEAGDIRFNFFELVDIVRSGMKEGQTLSAKQMETATAQLVKSLEVEKGSKHNVRINGRSTKCTAYTVTVPQEALEDWVWELEDASENVDYADLLEQVYTAMNLPEDLVEELSYEMGEYMSAPDFTEVYELLDELGDVELDVYVSGGKVAGIKFEDDVYGEDVELGLYVGGKEEYLDEVSFELIYGNEEYVLVSSGDHTAKGGTFTDELSYTYSYNGKVYSEFVLETEFDPKADSDNLSIVLQEEGARAELEATYRSEKGELLLDVEEFSASVEGEELFALSLRYSIGKYTKRVEPTGPVLLATLTEDDLTAIVEEVQSSAVSWAMDVIEKIPGLAELL